MAWGTDEASVSDHKLTLTSAAIIPAGGRLYFDHAFEFESYLSTYNYDAGVVETARTAVRPGSTPAASLTRARRTTRSSET
jgi:hypothetical protein